MANTLKSEHLATLRVRHVIFHDVPRHRESPPVLSEATTTVDNSHVAPLRAKLTKVLRSSHSYPVVFNIATPSPVPQQVRAYTDDPRLRSFVPMSQEVAKYLWTQHIGGVSAGLLCVLDVQVRDEWPGIVVMKLEREEGAQLQPSKDEKGRKTFSMSVLNNLVMTDGTRLFKTAIFVRTGSDEDDFIAVCCDDQSRVTASSDMAKFWLRFLGCSVTLDAKVATERFYDSAVRFINSQVADPVAKADLYEHLHSQLKSGKREFVPRTFITEYVPDELQRAFTEHLRSENAPITAFVKDLTDIEGRIKRHSYKTTRGAVVLVPSDQVEDLIEVTVDRIVVKDRVTSINPK
jgi:hypothetical protein